MPGRTWISSDEFNSIRFYLFCPIAGEESAAAVQSGAAARVFGRPPAAGSKHFHMLLLVILVNMTLAYTSTRSQYSSADDNVPNAQKRRKLDVVYTQNTASEREFHFNREEIQNNLQTNIQLTNSSLSPATTMSSSSTSRYLRMDSGLRSTAAKTTSTGCGQAKCPPAVDYAPVHCSASDYCVHSSSALKQLSFQ